MYSQKERATYLCTNSQTVDSHCAVRPFQHSGCQQFVSLYRGKLPFLLSYSSIPARRNSFILPLLHPSWDQLALPPVAPFGDQMAFSDDDFVVKMLYYWNILCYVKCSPSLLIWYVSHVTIQFKCVLASCGKERRLCTYVVVICTTPYPLLLLHSLWKHVCTSGGLLWACSYCSMQGGRNAFHLCAEGGHLAVAEYLAPKMEGHLFDSDDDGSTALHLAAYFSQLSMVEYLVRSCRFDVKAIDKVGLHCLLLAWCILWPLWAHLLHGHSRHGHLYLSCANLFVLCIVKVTVIVTLVL